MKDTFTFQMEEAFDNLYKTGAFFTAGNGEKANTMEISWGTIGFMWRKPIFMAMIRESRYTSKFLDLGKSFTISIPYNDDMKKALAICGKTSGRDTDKEKAAGIKFIPSKSVEAPVIEGCNKYYECKIMLKQPIDYNTLNPEIKKAIYPENETNHILFFGEIVEEY